MKTKKFIMLLAVVLLSGASAFAQSSNGTLKGDVNEDGVVDVADINAVIEIMKAGGGVVEPPTYYFSVGTTAPDASNYTTVNNATTTIPTTIEFTSSARVRHYFLIPDNKTLTVIDKNAQAAIPITENTSILIPNHKVYQTNGAIASGGTVIITLSDVQPTYYWYLGTSKLVNDTEIESNGTSINSASDIPNPFTIPSDEFVYLYYPKSFGKATLTQSGLSAAGKDVEELSGVSLTNYYGWRFPRGNNGGIINIAF